MERENYINGLNEVYNRYYCGENDNCKYLSECKQGVKYRNCNSIIDKYLFDRSRVGELYGQDDSIPHVVMVGVEGISGNNEIIKPSLDAENPHYNGVKYVLSYILADFLGQEKPKKVTKKSVNWVKEALKQYALCNLYKCAFVPDSNPKKIKDLCHSEKMQDNCFELLKSELNVLNPDIVVIQAIDSKVFTDKMRSSINALFDINWDNNYSGRASLGYGKIGSKKVCFVNTIHGAYGGFKAHKYLYEELNPVLDKAIEIYKNSSN